MFLFLASLFSNFFQLHLLGISYYVVINSYHNKYKARHSRSFQYDEEVSREDLLGAEESRHSSSGGGLSFGGGAGGGLFGTRVPAKSRLNTVFALASRDSVLSAEGLVEDIIVPHVAEREGNKVAWSVINDDWYS